MHVCSVECTAHSVQCTVYSSVPGSSDDGAGQGTEVRDADKDEELAEGGSYREGGELGGGQSQGPDNTMWNRDR